MTTLAPVAPKLQKLIPRLASPHDGEVVATVRAIERTLRSAGLDLHALAESITPPEPSRPPAPRSLRDIALWCRDNNNDRLNEREMKFVADVNALLFVGRYLSPKQSSWLRSLFERLQNG